MRQNLDAMSCQARAYFKISSAKGRGNKRRVDPLSLYVHLQPHLRDKVYEFDGQSFRFS